MKLHAQHLSRPVGAVALLATAVGLVLTGCGGHSAGGSSSGSANANSSSTGSAGTSTGSSSSSSTSGGGSTSTVSVASAPFPATVGNTWIYKTTVGLTGTTGKDVNKITAVKPVSAGQQVTMSSVNTIDGNTNSSTAYYIMEPNGAISLPFSQFSAAQTAGTQVKLVSGGIAWPPAADIASGKPYHSTLNIEYVQGGKTQKVTAHVTVKGAGTSTVTVPAGTYSNATIVEMTMAETFEGFKVSIEVKTWLANGVGPVQSEAIINELGADHIASENQLISFTKG